MEKTKTNIIPLNEILGMLKRQLIDLASNTITPLGYNLRRLAASADALHARKVMETIFTQNCKQLPMHGDYVMDIDWEAIAKEWDGTGSEEAIREEDSAYPPTYINCPPPENIKAWRFCDYEEKYIRTEEQEEIRSGRSAEEKASRDMNKPQYTKRLQPTWKGNVPPFLAHELGYGTQSRFLCEISRNEGNQLGVFLKKLCLGIAQSAQNMHTLLHNPNAVIDEKKLNALWADYFRRVMSVHGESIESEYERWYNHYIKEKNPNQLEVIKNDCWKQLKESGSLKYMIADYNEAEPEEMVRGFIESNFLHRDVPAKSRATMQETTAGSYLYALQAQCPEKWDVLAKAFLRYLYFCNQTEALYTPEQKRNKAIKKCILQLLSEKKSDGTSLVQRKQHWFAIYRILKDYYGFPEEPLKFFHLMKSMGLDEASVPCTYDSIKKSPHEMFYKRYNSWNEEKFEGNKDTYIQMSAIAKRFRQLLKLSRVKSNYK